MKKVLLTLIGGTQTGMKPLSTSILSAVMKAKGHEVVLFDSTFMNIGLPLDIEAHTSLKQFRELDYSKYGLFDDRHLDAYKEFEKTLERERPDVIAASCMTDTFSFTIRYLERARQKFDIPVIMGGVHPTLNPEEVIAYDCIDAICLGEGEEALLEYLDNLDGKTVKNPNIRNLWIKHQGQVVKNPLRPLVELDSLPFLDYSIYDKRQFCRPYMGKMYVGGDVQEKRGCPRKCTYCANSILNTKIYRQTRVNRYSPERFVEEMEYLKKTWGLTFCKSYSEDVANINTDELAKLSELYRKKVNLPFTAGGFPHSLTRERVKLLKNMNCASISIALECGNPQYRSSVLKRKYSNKLFAEKVALLNEFGIRSYVLTMIGLPYESRKMIMETVKAARGSKPKGVNCTCFFPYRGSPLGDLAIREGFVDVESLNDPAVRFERGRSFLNMPQIEAREVEAIRRNWFYYMNAPEWMFPLIKASERNGRAVEKLLKPVIDLGTKVRLASRDRI